MSSRTLTIATDPPTAVARRCRSFVLEKRELETARRFIAANGGNYVGYARENDRDVCVWWYEDVDKPVDVSDFPTYRMI